MLIHWWHCGSVGGPRPTGQSRRTANGCSGLQKIASREVHGVRNRFASGGDSQEAGLWGQLFSTKRSIELAKRLECRVFHRFAHHILTGSCSVARLAVAGASSLPFMECLAAKWIYHEPFHQQFYKGPSENPAWFRSGVYLAIDLVVEPAVDR